MTEPDEISFCAECGNVLFTDARGEFCVTCTSGRQKTMDKPAADPAVLLRPGMHVRIKATGFAGTIVGHDIDRGAVVYRVERETGVVEGGYLVKELERD